MKQPLFHIVIIAQNSTARHEPGRFTKIVVVQGINITYTPTRLSTGEKSEICKLIGRTENAVVHGVSFRSSSKSIQNALRQHPNQSSAFEECISLRILTSNSPYRWKRPMIIFTYSEWRSFSSPGAPDGV